MKKLLGAILILIALSGCDGKSSKNENPIYWAIDDEIDKIIEQTKKDSGDKSAKVKVEHSMANFYGSNILLIQTPTTNNNAKVKCAKEAIINLRTDEYNTPKEDEIKLIDSLTSLLCENEAFSETKSEALMEYAKNKFKEAFIEK